MSNQRLLFMKAGFHGAEALDAIIRRKQLEEATAGLIFWGYGGSLCHPLTQVQPFGQGAQRDNQEIAVRMAATPSPFRGTGSASSQFSVDGKSWVDLPKGVHVFDSRFALVLRLFRREELAIDLSEYKVAVGPSVGKQLSTYISGRCDKGCGVYVGTSTQPVIVPTVLAVTLIPPYAVALR